jgi:hypothetical protein
MWRELKNIFIAITILIAFICLMIFFSFPDLFAMYYVPHFLFEGNIYTWVTDNKPICQWLSATWPPLYYYTIGFYLKIIESIGIFPSHLIVINQCPVFDLITDKAFLFWAKLPFLILHISSAWIFAQFFQQNKKLWFLFWLLNPISIFINFIEGQFDSIPTFFLLLAFYYALIKKNVSISALALGIGGAYKHYPFLLLLPFAIILMRTVKSRVRFFILALIPYMLSVIPFLNNDFLQSLAFSENQKMLEAGISVNGMHISIYIVLYVILLLKLLSEKRKTSKLLIPYSFLFSSIYFVTSFWFVQRLLFLLPSLLLLARIRNNIFKLLPALSILFFLYVFFMFPGLFDHTLLRPILLSMHNMIYTDLPINTIQTFIFSVITGLFLWLIYHTLTEDDQKEQIITEKKLILSASPLILYFLLILLSALYSGSL